MFYYVTMVLIVVLLVRLLMAMLTATFNRIRSEAVLEWRLRLARNVLHAELMWPAFLGDTWAAPIDAPSGKHIIHLTEQATTSTTSNSHIFERQLPAKEQAEENFKVLSAKLETLEGQLQRGEARSNLFQDQVGRTLVSIQTKLGLPPTRFEEELAALSRPISARGSMSARSISPAALPEQSARFIRAKCSTPNPTLQASESVVDSSTEDESSRGTRAVPLSPSIEGLWGATPGAEAPGDTVQSL